MTNRFLFTACASTLLMASASAQSPVVQPLSPRVATEFSSQQQQQRQEGTVRVQSTISYFVPGPTDDGEAAQKLRDRSRRQIYETAARECSVLMETLASTCRMENITSNLNVNRQYGSGQQEGFTINGSMSYQITLK